MQSLLAPATRTCVAIVLGCTVLVAAVWLIALERIAFERDEAVESTLRQNANLAVAFEEHTRRTLQGLDRIVRTIRRESLNGASIDPYYIAGEAQLESAAVTTAAMIDEAGDIAASVPPGQGVNVFDRDYFQYHRDYPDGALRVGMPVRGVLTGRETIHLTRRVDRVDGSFAGVALVGVDPEYFARFYGEVDLGPRALIILVGIDGYVRARRAGGALTVGQDAAGTALFRSLGGKAAGSYLGDGAVDGVRRYISYRQLPDYPLIVAVGTAQDDVLAGAAARARNYVLGAALGTLLIVGFSVSLFLGDRRERNRRAEKRAAEARYRATFDQAAVGVTHCAPDGRFLRANAAFCGMLGYTEAELQALRFFDVIHPEDRPAAEQARQRFVVGEPDAPPLEQREVRKDGSIVWVSVAISMVCGADGKPEYFIGMVRDISDRTAAEAALRETNERFRQVTDNIRDVFWLTDPSKNTVLYISPAFELVWGRTCESLYASPHSWMEAIHPADRERVVRAAHEKQLKGEYDEEYRVIRPDGEVRWVRDRAFPVMRDGEVYRVAGIAEDITESRRAQEALRESEARFRSLTELSSDFYWESDAEHRLTMRGGKKSPVAVFDRDEQLGRRRWELPYLSPSEEGWSAHRETLRQRLPFRNFEISRRGMDGSERFISLSGDPVFDAGGAFAGYRGVGTDITERRRAERARLEGTQRAALQAQALAEVSGCEALGAGDVHRVARLVTELASHATGVRRANVWLFNDDETELRCLDLYEAGLGRHSAGARLAEKEFGNEFHAFKSAAYVNADDPLNDPRTAGYVESYLKPHGITSMLDAVVQVSGRNLGVLCLEHVGTAHRWTEDEIAFACQLADKIALAIVNGERRDAEDRYRATFDQAAVGIAHAGLDGRLVRVNAAFARMLGYEPAELCGRSFADLTHPEDRELSLAVARELAVRPEDRSMPEYEKRYLRKDGSSVWGAVSISLVRDPYGAAAYYIALVKDIGARKAAEDELVRQAHYDALTALPNRTLCFDRLAQALAQARRKKWSAGVLFLDLDRFKAVNDTLGHGVGDAMLREVAARLSACVRPGDTVARVGGDEFIVAMAELARPQDAAVVAQKVLAALAAPLLAEGQEVFISASIGVATYPTDGDDATMLVRNADAALLRAKSLGRNNYQFYTAEMNERALEKLQMSNDLRRAVERGEFRLHYQPKVSLRTGALTGFEALLRWTRPGQGPVSPAAFVPLLEDSGLIVPVGDWTIDAACAQQRAWRDAGYEPVPVAVNLTAKQFMRHDIAAAIERALARHGIESGLLEVEITESDAMEDPEKAVAVLTRLQGLGVRVAVDDFGTGYSSLAYLKRLPLDTLKLDRSFVTGLPRDANDAAIAPAVIAMAHRLGLRVVAEGVETEPQRLFLAVNRCDEMQGYLFSRPLPAEECARFLHGAPAAASAA